MRRYPDAPYATHLLAELPVLCAAHDDVRGWLQRNREVVEELLALDLDALRPQLEALHPVRPGGRRPFDPVVLVRSLWLGCRLAGGRWNAWVAQLRSSTLLRVLLGLPADRPAPSVGTHYRFMQRLLRASDVAGVRQAELDRDARGRFRRVIRDEEGTGAGSDEGACADMRRLLARQGVPSPEHALDLRLVDWLALLGVRAMAEAGVLPPVLRVAIDGTSKKSHARGRGHQVEGEEEPAEAASGDGAGDPGSPLPGRTGRRRGKGGGGVVPTARLRWYSDPSATWHWSNGSRSVEFGYLSVAITARHRGQDIPLFIGSARPHEGETPAAMRLLEAMRVHLGRHVPQVRVDSVAADAGYDAAAFFRFCHDRGWAPVVAWRDRPGADPELPRTADGSRPACPGGLGLVPHDRLPSGIQYRCPAVRSVRGAGDRGQSAWVFDETRCPLGERCSLMQDRNFLRVRFADNPRQNLPIPPGSPEWQRRYDERTSVERLFSGLHARLEDRRYRRHYVWEIASAMYVLHRQLALVVRADRSRFAGFWEQVLGPPVTRVA